MHLANRIQHIALQMLNVVQIGELAPTIRRQISIELLGHLPTEIIAVHQKQHALRLRMLNQPIGKTHHSKRLPRPSRHLNQRPVGDSPPTISQNY